MKDDAARAVTSEFTVNYEIRESPLIHSGQSPELDRDRSRTTDAVGEHSSVTDIFVTRHGSIELIGLRSSARTEGMARRYLSGIEREQRVP